MGKDTNLTVGLDIGDRWIDCCVLDDGPEPVRRERVRCTPEAVAKHLCGLGRARVAMEACTHSPWLSRQLAEAGHEVVVANARRVQLISRNDDKRDAVDAELLARLARVDPQLLSPVDHVDARLLADKAILRARDALVQGRANLINCVRGLVKPHGTRLPQCSAPAFASKVAPLLPEALRPALEPLLVQIASLTARIRSYDQKIEELGRKRYPVTQHLQRIRGVGPITSLAFVLEIGDPRRFSSSRDVGSYVGLCPRRQQSGQSDPQLRITKAGSSWLRRLLVQCAQYVVGHHGEDSDLKRWALPRVESGSKIAKKKALVAVARKLAVRLHQLWVTGAVYDPLWLARQRGLAPPAET